MTSEKHGAAYWIWGPGKSVHGPVELPALVESVQAGRVGSGSWLFAERDHVWRRADETPELRMFFRTAGKARAATLTETLPESLPPGALRRIKILAELTDGQLQEFVRYVEPLRVAQWATVVRQGDHGDAMFMVMEGELRARLAVSGKETTLATLGPGDFFGEISLFDHGPRSADVLANASSLLLKLSAASFQRLVEEAPHLAAPFLLAVTKTLTQRIRADNKRYRDSIVFNLAGRNQP